MIPPHMSKILNNLNERQLMAALHFRNLADQSCAISSQTVFDPDEKIRGQGGAPHARALDHFHIVRRIGAIRKAVDNLGAFHVGSERAANQIDAMQWVEA